MDSCGLDEKWTAILDCFSVDGIPFRDWDPRIYGALQRAPFFQNTPLRLDFEISRDERNSTLKWKLLDAIKKELPKLYRRTKQVCLMRTLGPELVWAASRANEDQCNEMEELYEEEARKKTQLQYIASKCQCASPNLMALMLGEPCIHEFPLSQFNYINATYYNTISDENLRYAKLGLAGEMARGEELEGTKALARILSELALEDANSIAHGSWQDGKAKSLLVPFAERLDVVIHPITKQEKKKTIEALKTVIKKDPSLTFMASFK